MSDAIASLLEIIERGHGVGANAAVLCGNRVLTVESDVNVHDRATGQLLVRGLIGLQNEPNGGVVSSRLVRQGAYVFVFTFNRGYVYECTPGASTQ